VGVCIAPIGERVDPDLVFRESSSPGDLEDGKQVIDMGMRSVGS